MATLPVRTFAVAEWSRITNMEAGLPIIGMILGILKANPWTVVGGKNDQGIFSQTKFFDCLTNLPDGMIDLLHRIPQ